MTGIMGELDFGRTDIQRAQSRYESMSDEERAALTACADGLLQVIDDVLAQNPQSQFPITEAERYAQQLQPAPFGGTSEAAL